MRKIFSGEWDISKDGFPHKFTGENVTITVDGAVLDSDMNNYSMAVEFKTGENGFVKYYAQPTRIDPNDGGSALVLSARGNVSVEYDV